jgi:HSP20 family protein
MNTCSTPQTEQSATQMGAPVGVRPRYTVDGDKESYSIRVELPGVKKDNLDINLDGELLTIRAKRNGMVPAGWKTLHRELLEDDFVLRLKLNASVNESKLAARLEDGVLIITLPIKDAVKPRTIPVS